MERWQIEMIIPHRPPFLLVDKIIELVPGQKAVGLTMVSEDGCLLADCGGGKRAMPGTLVLEVMGQVGAVAVLSLPEHRGKITMLAGIDNARFYGNVPPCAELRVEAEITGLKMNIGRRRCRAKVGETVIAKADLLFVLVDGVGLQMSKKSGV
ncbi:MAG: 3-hydroxyacyl-[acyl-carrier-protein] dehydratase FabZ [Actinobacteria bacterium]|nr:3-hydroxyacyl-[acyl-carrier-protein] dehydratase FabZ [Actinomycetota bacterium]